MLLHLPTDIKAGWGSVFDPENVGRLKASVPCPANTYGVADTTFGLNAAPCKVCTQNLKSAPGSTSYKDCKVGCVWVKCGPLNQAFH